MPTQSDKKYKDHMEDLLNKTTSYILSAEDKKDIKNRGEAEWISHKLLRTNFRRSKLKDETFDLVKKKVTEAISLKQPIKIILGFGGYKHFAIRSFPKPNWAEFFNLAFIREWLAPVLVVHTEGVYVEYESEDIILEIANGYSQKDLDAYSKEFSSLLELFNKTNPKGLTFGYVRARDQYDVNILKQKIDALVPIKLKELENLSEDIKEERIKRSGRNLIPDTPIKPIYSKALNLAFLDADFELRGPYFDSVGTVPVVFTFGIDVENFGSWPVIGSTRSSFTDFWIGEGVLEDRGNRIIECVLSPNQFADKKELLESHDISSVPLENFKVIEVFKNLKESN